MIEFILTEHADYIYRYFETSIVVAAVLLFLDGLWGPHGKKTDVAWTVFTALIWPLMIFNFIGWIFKKD